MAAMEHANAHLLGAPGAFQRTTLYTERMPRHEYTARYGSAKTGLGFL